MRSVLIALALACAAVSAAAQTVARPHEIPFQFVLERQIVFPVVVNGNPAEAWLDSGAGMTVLDAGFARELGVALGPPIRAHGVAGEVKDVRLANADLRAGDLVLAGRRVVVMDLSGVARVVQRPVQVLLGRDVFDQAVVDIDFERRRVELIPRAEFSPPTGAAVTLKPSGDLRSIPLVIGGAPTEAILDLGNAGGLLLDQGFVDGHGLLAGRKLSTELGVGADGAREEIQTALDRVELGGVSFDAVPAVVAQGLSSRAPANVGLQVLSRFHLTIDFAGDRLWMAPYADAASRPFRKNRAGLMLVGEDGRAVVEYVAKGSPADRAGWRKGDIVTAVDGEPVPVNYSATEASLWVYGPAGRTVALTGGDGRRHELTLADYY